MANLKKITQLLENQRRTQVWLASETGLTPQGIQSILKSNTTTTTTLEKIAKVLEVPVGYFFDEVPAPSSNVVYGSNNNYNNNTSPELVEMLKKQIEEKDNTIKTLLSLLESQKK